MTRPPKKHEMPDGSFKTVKEIAQELKVAPTTIYKKLATDNYVVTAKVLDPLYDSKKAHFIEDNEHGKIHIAQIAKDNDLPYKIVYERFRKGKKRTYAELSAPIRYRSLENTEQLETLKEFKRLTANDKY